MAGKITELAVLAPTVVDSADLLEAVDVSDTSMAASGTNKKLTLDALWQWLTPRAVITVPGSSTALLGEFGCYLRFTGSNPTYTIPPNSSVAFPVGTFIDGIGTTSAMTLVAGSGVTLVKARTLVTLGAGSGWTAIKVATDTWDLHGDFV